MLSFLWFCGHFYLLDNHARYVYDTCMNKRTSKQPQITVYLPQHLIEALKREARKQGRSMNRQAVWCLAQCVGVSLDEGDTGLQDRTRPQ